MESIAEARFVNSIESANSSEILSHIHYKLKLYVSDHSHLSVEISKYNNIYLG